MRKTTMLVAATTAVALASFSCGGDNAAGFDLVTEGTLTICADIPYSPFVYEDNGEVVGFEIEIMDAIATDLGLDTVWLATDYEMVKTGTAMTNRTCDMAAGAIPIRQEQEDGGVDFGDPYFTSGQSLLVKKDSGIQELADMEGKRLGAQATRDWVTRGYVYAGEHNPGAARVIYRELDTMLLALEAGEIDGVIFDLGPSANFAKTNSAFEVVEVLTNDDQYGFAFKAGNDGLRTAVNDALAKIREDGTYQTIYDKYFTAD